MQFIAPVSLDSAVRILQSHADEIPVLADTVVEIAQDDQQAQGIFTVKRRWKARRGWGKYTVVSLRGVLMVVSDEQTSVTVQVELGAMAYIIVGLVILCMLGVPQSDDPGVFIIAVIVISLLLVLDAYVLYRIVDSLKGRRQRR